MELINVIPFMAGLLIVTVVATVLAPSMRDGRLPRNTAIGIKTKHTMASDAAWLRGHAAGAPCLKAAALAGWILLPVVGVLCLLQLAGLAFAVTAAGYAAVIVLALLSANRANTAAKYLAAQQSGGQVRPPSIGPGPKFAGFTPRRRGR